MGPDREHVVAFAHRNEDRIVFSILFALIVGFAAWNRPFVNYAYDYVHYIPLSFSIALALACLCLGIMPTPRRFLPETISVARCRVPVAIATTATLTISFWIFSTEFHVFSGDGGEWAIPGTNITPFDRLDDVMRCLFHRIMWRIADPGLVDVLPSYFAQKCYSVFFGAATVATVLFACRREVTMGFTILTSFWMLNFFGNLDSYAFAIWYAFLFWTVLRELRRRRPEPSFAHAALVVALWIVGLWVHPLQVFLGFFVIEYLNPWTRRMGILLSNETIYVLFGLVAFILLRCSRYSIPLFPLTAASPIDSSDFRHYDSVFTSQTMVHYLNNIVLPFLAWLTFLALKVRNLSRIRGVLVVIALVSLCFFSLNFILGAVDQFSYYHLLCILSLYLFDACSRNEVGVSALRRIALLNLFVLVPMVWVHSGPLTIDRAKRIYPYDRCRQNEQVSWQSHLGILLGNNIQESFLIEENVLGAFLDGAMHSDPPALRLGNYTYYVAWHYQYGHIEEGRRLLAELLQRYPQASGYLLGDKPGFIYFNARILRSDTLRFLSAGSPKVAERLRPLYESIERHATDNPFFTRPSPYEVLSVDVDRERRTP